MPTTAELDTSVPLPAPLAELHLHLEGTLEPAAIFELAGRNGIVLPYAGVDDLAERYRFTGLQSFLDLYFANMSTLVTQADFEDMTRRYLLRAHAAGVRHAEVFVDPQAHTARGIATGTVLHGVHAAMRRAAAELHMTGGIIVCALRDQPPADAMDMLDTSLATGVPLLGLGLSSAEAGHPPADFREVFAAAGEAGLRRVAHAGEEGPPEYIWQALDLLGAERIDHGVRCLEDPALVARLAAERIPLTVCPLSNVCLRVVDRLADHPLRRMLDAGLAVCVNSDDPAYFGGYLDDNLRACADTLRLDRAALDLLAANSIAASFASEARKRDLLDQLAAHAPADLRGAR
ncbi:adenosine deaminase [Streptomyces sp. NPDC056161]|uniref:adenosine deaminase n=1 Tax=Streptomyces sp. NPDC056161 TaxID=3345732 RepID=UPI0035D879A5